VDLPERRHLYNGFGNALTRAMELVAVPLLFALAGWLVDRWLGSAPVATIAFGAFGLAGIATRAYFQYAADMAAHERALPSRRGDR
jgi:F0F1-type ATP synthase assembly protein I